MEIKFGLKLFSTNQSLLSQAAKLIENDWFHYIELTYIPGTEIAPFLKTKVPYVIHIPTDIHGVNIADREHRARNLEIVKRSIAWADVLGVKFLVLHPGFGDANSAKLFLEEFEDGRILLENMPKIGINDEDMIGFLPEQIDQLMGENFGLCLDLNHAIKAAISLNLPYREFIVNFMKLKPRMFHIADGRLDFEKDEHLDIGEGDYDFRFLLNCMMNNESRYVTLETPRTSLNDDIINLKALRTIHREMTTRKV